MYSKIKNNQTLSLVWNAIWNSLGFNLLVIGLIILIHITLRDYDFTYEANLILSRIYWWLITVMIIFIPSMLYRQHKANSK